MSEALLFIIWMVVTIFACGMWAGWAAGRQHEKSKRIVTRLRGRRKTAAEATRES